MKYTKLMILPLDTKGTIYMIQDEQGKSIGTGTREVLEVILHMLNKVQSMKPVEPGINSARSQLS